MIDFVEELKARKKLAPGCRLIFSRISGFDRFDDIVQNAEKKFGVQHKRIRAEENPLYEASEQAEANDVHSKRKRTYYHKQELRNLITGIKYVIS